MPRQPKTSQSRNTKRKSEIAESPNRWTEAHQDRYGEASRERASRQSGDGACAVMTACVRRSACVRSNWPD